MGLQNAAYNGKVTNQVGQREKELCVRARVDRIVVHLLVQCISNSQQQRFWISHDTDYRFSFYPAQFFLTFWVNAYVARVNCQKF